MQALMRLHEVVEEFVEQGDEYVLLLSCSDTDVPLVHKVLERLDQTSPDVILRFAEPVEDLLAWVDAVMQALTLQILGGNVIRAESRLPAWPVLPAACYATGSKPEMLWSRLDAAMQHVAALFTEGSDDLRILWVFAPTQIAEPVAFIELVSRFLPSPAWRAGHRVAIRSPDLLVEHMQKSVLTAIHHRVDFSPAAIEADLVRRTNDPSASPPERATSLMQLAGIDIANHRIRDALRKYDAVFKFFSEDPSAVGLCGACLLDVGDIAQRLPQTRQAAFDRYRQVLAMCAPDPGCLALCMRACKGLGDLHFEDGAYDLALAHYQQANTIATKLCILTFKADVMEQIGLLLHSTGERLGAVTTWQLARELAIDGQYHERVQSLDSHLAKIGVAP